MSKPAEKTATLPPPSTILKEVGINTRKANNSPLKMKEKITRRRHTTPTRDKKGSTQSCSPMVTRRRKKEEEKKTYAQLKGFWIKYAEKQKQKNKNEAMKCAKAASQHEKTKH